MTYTWLSNQFSDIADGTSWSFSSLQQFWFELQDLDPGTQIKRTRITGQVVVGCKTIDPMTFVPGEFISGANQMQVGVYYAGSEGLNWPPPSPSQSPSDGGWLMRCQMQQQSLTTFLDINSLEYYWAVYTIPDACINSEAERGAAAAATKIGLSWTFFNPIEEVWTVANSDQLGLISAAWTVETLIKT